MRVLVTGHRGYVGSVLTGVLRNARFDPVGLDARWFSGCDFGCVHDDGPEFECDVRDLDFSDLLSFDAVVHLAGISDDPTGEIDAELTHEINVDAAIRLAEHCRQAQVGRFIFMSSCSVYGAGGPGMLDERSPTNPLTTYAKAKLETERRLLEMSDSSFAVMAVRPGTIYGVSPALRLDLVVNDFVAEAVSTGRVEIRSTGGAWRPLVHVEDVSRAVLGLLRPPTNSIAGKVFNLVPPDANYRVVDIADEVAEQIPHTRRLIVSDRHDPRSYRVNGERLLSVLPGFSYRWDLQRGIRQLADAMQCNGLSPSDWRSERFRRSLRLRAMMERGEVDASLRRCLMAV